MKIAVICLFIVCIANTIALGVAPAASTIDYLSDQEITGAISITQSQGAGKVVSLSTRGELGDYITLSKEQIFFEDNQVSQEITYTIRLPQDASAGQHTAQIVITETNSGANTQETAVGSTLSVIHQINIYKKYPGKYVTSEVNLKSQQSEEVIEFNIPIISAGEEDIDNIDLTIEIYKNNKKIDTIQKSGISIKTNQKQDITQRWYPRGEQGEFKAKIKIEFDGQSVELEKGFNIGETSTNNPSQKYGIIAVITVITMIMVYVIYRKRSKR